VNAFVAERRGELAGIVHFLLHRSTTQISPVCYLQDLFTAEHARGQGVGRALIESVYRHAAALGCPRVYWQTHESNQTAMRLYDAVAEKSGFVVYRRDLH
jgi:GNAT superfamily N-acetyltransferase